MKKYEKEIGGAAFILGLVLTAGYVYITYDLFERAKSAAGGYGAVNSLIALLQEKTLLGFAFVTFWWVCISGCLLYSLLKK